MDEIELGDVVVDNHGREGIVIREDPTPGPRWLADQEDERMRAVSPGARWLAILPLTGGLTLCPESLLQRVRNANESDILNAAEAANEPGVRYLVELFPGVVRRIISKRTGP